MAASRRRPRSAPKPSTGTHLADRMPLSHFPAGTRFTNWQRWSALASAQARGVVAVQPTRHAGFKQLEDTHVFFFAGPCAYTRSGPLGDAAIWMHPDVERGATGGASPFDTGALETGRLRPWHTTDLDNRWNVHTRRAHTLGVWRGEFAAWLDAVYVDPRTYLDTARGRRASGDPDKGHDPDGVFATNGTRDPSGADRRAWTWEVRLTNAVTFDRAEALLLPRRLAEDARRWKKASGSRAKLFFLERESAVGADDVFRESERVCRALLEEAS